MMTRRSGSAMKYIFVGLAVVACLYGLYSYHDLHTRLVTAEEKVDRLRQQHDSVSAQMQVVYEHKSRLEASLQQEKNDHQRTKDTTKQEQSRLKDEHETEKSELMGRIDSINQENKMIQSQKDDHQLEITKLKEELSNLKTDVQQKDSQHNDEYLQFKQEKDFEISKLKDDNSNLIRRIQELQMQLNTALQNQAVDQSLLQKEADKKRELREEIDVLKAQLQQRQQMQNNILGNQAQPVLNQQSNQIGQQNQANVLGRQQFGQQNLGLQGQQNLLGQAKVPGIIDNQQNLGLQGQQNLLGQGNVPGIIGNQPHNDVLHMDQQQHYAQPHDSNLHHRDDTMQIAQPGEKKPYYEPKNEGIRNDQPPHYLGQNNENDLEGGKVVNEQVARPNLQDNPVDVAKDGKVNNVGDHKEKESEIGEKAKSEDGKVLNEQQGILESKQIGQNGAIIEPNNQDQKPLQAPVGAHADADSKDDNGGLDADNAKEMDIALQKKQLPGNNINEDKAREHDYNEGNDDEKQLNNDNNINDRPRLIGQGLRGHIGGVGEEQANNKFNNQNDQEKMVAPKGVEGEDENNDDYINKDSHKIIEDRDDYGR